jgi:nitrogen-specific signal transduction histidine kinase/CheY-like chemotaxis protein
MPSPRVFWTILGAVTLDAHPELLGTAAVVGALTLMIVRQVIAWRLAPQQPAWPWVGITVCGIVFALTRIVHLASSSPEVALYMIRVQYAIGLILPGLGMATVEVLAERPISRATKLAIVCALPVQTICVVTPFLVRGPLELHRDIFGDPYYGAHTGWMVLFILPIATLAMILIRSRVAAMPESFTKLRRGFRSGVLVFALAGLHDSLVGAGVFHSMFLLEYAFVAFGVIAANFDLRRAAIIANQMETSLADKRAALDDQESRLERANQRVDRSTTRYRHLADATNEGVVLCAGTRILDVNLALCTMLSSGEVTVREADTRGSELSALVSDPDRATMARLMISESGPVEVMLVKFDGSKVPVSVKAMVPPDGSLGTRILLVRDISAERELQRRLATADRLAAIGTLAAGTAHEINNPLAFVTANADMLEEDERLAPDHREMIADIRLGAHRIRDVVRDLMSLARDRGGEVATIDVGEVVRRCIAMAAPQTRHRTRVKASFDRMLPVRANEGRLFQVFLNLIVNAAQAIREGNVDNNCITIAGHSEDGVTIIEIADTGDGMAASVVDRIFEPFFTTKEVGHGTGLGLSISHGIITDLGGTIEVKSALGKGTTFRVTIPTTEEREPDITGPIQRQDAPRLRVLIIDDELPFARSLARMLETHDVDIAGSGRLALEQLAKHDYDVALCDVMMPDVTGIQLYERLVANHDPVAERFLFMTGGVFSSEAQRFLEAVGSTRWVPKPIGMTDLRRMVTDIGAR